MNWLREKGARRIALLAPRVDESWLRDIEGEQTRVCRCDVGDAGQLATVLDELAANGGIAGAIHAAGVLADAPLQELDHPPLAAVFAVKAQAATSYCKPCATTADVILFSTPPLPPPSAPRVKAPMRWPAVISTGWPNSFPPLMRRKRSLSPGAHGGESGRAATPEMLAALASRGMGALSDAEGCWHLEQAVMRGTPWRLADARFHRQNAPVTTGSV